MNIGESIKYWRLENGLTQKQLAEASNISEISIRKYEAGDRVPKIGTLSDIARALNITIGDLDSDYTTMLHDRSEAINLVTQMKNFINNIPTMDTTETVKQQATIETNSILKKVQELIKTIDLGISSDKEMRGILNESRNLKKEIQEAEQEVDEMFLSVLHQLNSEGQDKTINYALDLTKIPEYQKKDENTHILVNAAHARTDIEVTEEMKKHDDDIMNDENF